MTATEYYQHQGECRNIRTDSDVQKILARQAATYDRAFAAWLAADRTAEIHEVACGPGILLRWLKAKGYQNVTGCDIAPHEVALARVTGFPITTGDAIANLKHFNSTVDTIFAIDFIEHIPREVVFSFLNNAYSALKNGGTLILRMPNGDSPFVGKNLYNDVTHEWAYTTTSFKAISSICNFTNIEFLDDTLISISHWRPLKLPLMWLAQGLLKTIFRAATHERFDYLGASIFVCLRK